MAAIAQYRLFLGFLLVSQLGHASGVVSVRRSSDPGSFRVPKQRLFLGLVGNAQLALLELQQRLLELRGIYGCAQL